MRRLWPRRLGVAALVAVAGLAAAGAADRGPSPLLVNESPSLARGLYRRAAVPVARGAVVTLPQPPVAQAYLGGLGMPGDVALLKRVAAVGGEQVCAEEDAVRTPLGTRVVLDRDRRGVRLPRWSGCRVLADREVFLLGDTASSFDSRYFGPVDIDDLTGVYQEVITW